MSEATVHIHQQERNPQHTYLAVEYIEQRKAQVQRYLPVPLVMETQQCQWNIYVQRPTENSFHQNTLEYLQYSHTRMAN